MVVLVPEALTDRGGTARLAKQLSATASSNFGSTRSSAYLVGTPPGVSGSICRTKVGVDATFVQCGKYRKRTMHGELIRWETSFRPACGSSPDDFQPPLEMAKTTYHR